MIIIKLILFIINKNYSQIKKIIKKNNNLKELKIYFLIKINLIKNFKIVKI